MATRNPDPNMARHQKQQERARKDAPLVKAAAAKAREENRWGFEDLKRQRAFSRPETDPKE